MLKNYFKIAFRNLLRHRLFSFINIFGLALSMSVCLLVIMHVKDQLAYDTFHPQAGRTYRVITALTNEQGASFRMASSALPLAAELAGNYPFIEKTVRFYTAGSDKATVSNENIRVNGVFTDAAFFDVFGFTLQSGNAPTTLAEPGSIVLSAETAFKLFGKASALGRTVHMNRLGNFQVTGVLRKSRVPSHLDFDGYLSMSSVPGLEKSGSLPAALDTWNNQGKAYTYVLLKKESHAAQLNAALQQVAAALVSRSTLKGRENLAYEAQPLNRIILGEELLYNLGNTGSWGKMLAEVLTGFIILLSACFNYTNLSIARSLNRGREVGIRKVAGAFRYQVFVQFILESVLFAFVSLALALVLLQLMIAYAPFIGEIGRPDLSINSAPYGWFAAFTLFTGILAGALPAWVLSAFKPVEVLKNLANVRLFGSNHFRKGLIIAQFTLALVIIIFTGISSRQFAYIATADPGYDREDILMIQLQGTSHRILAGEIAGLSGVRTTTAVSAMPGRNPSGQGMIRLNPGLEPMQVSYYDVDPGFIAMMRLTLLAGETFLPQADETQETAVIVNEKALQLLKVNNPADAIGKIVWLQDTVPVRVAGVVKNFHYSGLAVPVGPLLLRSRAREFNLLAVKTTPDHASILKEAAAIWKKENPALPFTSTWYGEELYNRQSAGGTVSMLTFLAFMTVTIACLGLLGMVIYNTETRRKEIGIRKVMGAGAGTIILLLVRGFIKLVIIAGLIALPVSYVCGYLFLNIFANRVAIHAGSLVLSFLGLLVLATISAQIFRVATANPVKSLRTE